MSAVTQQILQDSEALSPEMQAQVLDFVHFLQQKNQRHAQSATTENEPNGTKLARLMEKIATRGTAFKDITDPVAWQREIRKDHPLPCRKD